MLIREPLYHIHIVLNALSADVDNDLGVISLEKFKISFDKSLYSGVLKPDGIEHSTIDFRNPGHGVPLPGHI